MDFQGFREETFGFFRELNENNTVEWFDENQDRFEEHVLEPMRQLVRALREDLEKMNPNFVQDEVDDHFSEMRRGPRVPPGTPPIKTSFYAFFWDKTVRRLSDGWMFVGVGADGVTIGMSIYDFGDPESRLRRVFKPRLRRNLVHLDEYIKASYLRRGFDFHRYVRAASKLGMREVDPFPTAAAEWDHTLGWVIKRHLNPDSSRLTPGSFLTEVKESFERLYPLYVFTSDTREDFLRLIRVPGRPTPKPLVPPPPPPKPAPVAAKKPAKGKAKEKGKEETTKATEAPAETRVETTATAADAKSATTKSTTKSTTKKSTKKKAAAKKKTAKKAVAKKKSSSKKKAAAKKKTSSGKKAAAKKKAPSKKKTAAKAKKKTTSRRSSSAKAVKKKASSKKKTTARKAAAKKKSAKKKTAAKKKAAGKKKAAAKKTRSKKKATAKKKRSARGAKAGAKGKKRKAASQRKSSPRKKRGSKVTSASARSR